MGKSEKPNIFKPVAAKAAQARDFVSTRTRSSLDKAYLVKKEVAVAKVAKLRAENKKATPVEIIALLDAELKSEELHAGTNNDAFTSAVAIYVCSVIEVYGANKKNQAARQRLIDALVVMDSKVTKNVAKYGGVAVALFSKRLRVVGAAVATLASLRSKAPWLKRGLAILGIKNPGKKGAAFAVIAATKKTLGQPPKAWPATKKA